MVGNGSPLEERRRLARRVPEEIASEGAIDVVDEPFAEDVVARISPLGAAEGRDEFRELPRRTRGAFPDLEATVDATVAEGDRVAMRVALSGTHRGRFVGVDPTGESFESEHAIHVRFAGDGIVELWGRLDAFGLLRGLGAIEDPTG
jgi:predicted ester cyclase